ncbi:MAG TPA: hypothetical protein VMS75_05795 [Terriglobales bacterium]|nr:hypothetical protein [Terriglobales bacterium]
MAEPFPNDVVEKAWARFGATVNAKGHITVITAADIFVLSSSN